jgi:hypothetical protein
MSLHASTAPLRVGDRTKARFMGGRNWYPGVVSMLFSDGTHGTSYDDGDREARIPRNMIQLLEDPR